MIRITNLNKYYYKGMSNENHVINDISIELPESGLVAIFGKSGCGKTTLLNLIGGLDKPNSGEILINGEKESVNNDKLRNGDIGYIFQNYNLNIGETVLDNVKDALRLCGMEDEDELEKRAVDALTSVGMEKFRLRYPMALSGGQMQRVAIARAIVKNPKVILADEPTGNLDEQNTLLVMDLLKQISKIRLVVLVTHEESLVDYYCDRVIEIVDGKITNIKLNENANGLNSKNKNDIYLGELEKSSINNDNINIDYYGAKVNKDIKLKLVNYKGKLFLELENDDITILTKSSEVKLKEGTFEERKAEVEPVKFEVKPFNQTRFGHLFNFKTSIRSGYNANFKGTKKGGKLLRISMFFFSLIFVIITATTGVAFNSLINVRNSYDNETFYVYTDSMTTLNKIKKLYEEDSGIDFYTLNNDSESKNISLPTFETTNANDVYTSGISVNATSLPISKLNYKMLVGTSDIKEKEVIITKKVAQNIIKSANVKYIKTLKDVIGLNYTYYGQNTYKIIGVCDSNNLYMYFNDLEYAKKILNEASYSVYLSNNIGRDYESGTGAYYGDTTYKVGNTVYINNVAIRITEVITMYNTYVKFAKTKDASFTSHYNENTYFTNKASEKGITKQEAKELYYGEYLEDYYQYLDAYIDNNYMRTMDEFAFAVYKDYNESAAFDYIVIYMTGDNSEDSDFSIASELGMYYLIYRDLKKVDDSANYTFTDIKKNYYYDFQYEVLNKYYELENSYYGKYIYNYGSIGLYVNSQDYIKMSQQLGTSSKGLYHGFDYTKEPSKVYSYDTYTTVIHSNNPKQTREVLIEEFGDYKFEYTDTSIVTTPEGKRTTLISNISDSIVANLVTYVVIIVVLSICMYFIMRSSMIKRIKEIGIYRAIGTSKKNITFKFFIEAIVLCFLTVIIGNIITSVILSYCYYKFTIVASFMYYPIWLALCAFALESVICVFFGTLPVMILLRKTPSEILSKYDI